MKSDFAEAVERIRLWLLLRDIPTKDLRLELVFPNRNEALLAGKLLNEDLAQGAVAEDQLSPTIRGVTIALRWPTPL